MNANYDIARNHTALVDLANEGRIRVSGADAEQALNACFSMDLEIVLPWKGVSGLFLDEQARLLAIATVFKGEDEYFVFTEAASAAHLLEHLSARLAGADAELEDLSKNYGWICLLGPNAQSAVAQFAGEDALGLPYMGFEENSKLGSKLFRMGFCGEFEYRLLCPLERLQEMTAGFVEDGEAFGVRKIEPEVMSLLMLEMRSLGIADIPRDADPIQAGLHWMVNFRKDGYPGRDAVHAAKSQPRSRSLMLLLNKAGVAKQGDRIRIEGKDCGFLARVEYSPTLERDIALAYADPEFGWVGVSFTTVGENGSAHAKGVSAPLFVTKTVSRA